MNDTRETPGSPLVGDAVVGWFTGRLPEDWYDGPPSVEVDRDEILVVGDLTAPSGATDPVAVAEAESGRIARFREETREERMRIAREAQHRFGRTVSWGARAGATRLVFTNLSVPVMTRLRQPERRVLDTLVDSGVARSRAEALSWCVKLVGSNAGTWLADLRQAMEAVQQVRGSGPA